MSGVRDWAVALGVAVILLVAGLSDQEVAPVGYPLLVLGGLALAARRRFPVGVLVVTGLCAVGYQAAGFDVFAVAYLIAVYGAVRAGRHVATVAVSLLVLAGLPLAALASGMDGAGAALTHARDVLQLAWLIAAGAAGEALRQAERRAEEAERTREEVARRRADEERLHLARELHDSLTHQISVIKVQAEAAVHLAHKRGEPVDDAMLAIRDAGREAARELRATLEALRDDEGTPPHGIGHLPDLVRQARTTGLDVTLQIDGEPSELPSAVERTAFRIVQESLTNVTRHAAATTTTVRIGYRPDAVTVRVDDDGRAGPESPPVPGVGLLGMRERVTALGGTLRTGARGDGGFTVQAELPVVRRA
ncbi:sensor histidine kinase [Cryptosporangium sp. NPDC051539]|uniref:sensor histidine kinase n=1 Tax=Cryptosporangium sp. NPDC051539 TaxID=3363962 RepID=UPI0037A95468